jgi:hypothetical protein
VQAGHAVHEDEAARTAELLRGFAHRFRMGEPKGPVPLPARGAGPPVLPIAAGPASGGEALAAAKAM